MGGGAEQNTLLLFTSSGRAAHFSVAGRISSGSRPGGGWAGVDQDVMTWSPHPPGAVLRSGLDPYLGLSFPVCKFRGSFSCPHWGGWGGIDGVCAPLACGFFFPFHALARGTGVERGGRDAPQRPLGQLCSHFQAPAFPTVPPASHWRAAGSAGSRPQEEMTD